MAPLTELEQMIAAVTDAHAPAVVGLGHGRGQGCGVVVGKDRVITLARHVGDTGVGLSFADGRQLEAEVVGQDSDLDLAALSADTGSITGLSWADTDPGIGRAVIALANPGGRGLRATVGFVCAVGTVFRSHRGRTIATGIEHTAPLVPGSGGGPLLDSEGRLVGLNTLRLTGGLIVATSAVALRDPTEQLFAGTRRPPRRLGIAVARPGVADRLREAVGLPAQDGVLVHSVADESPAHRAGLRRGDLIVAAAGRPIAQVDDLYPALDSDGTADAVELSLVRGTHTRHVTVSFAPADEEGTNEHS
jgi:serine protease Do